MTPQTEATLILLRWQQQREADIPAEKRKVDDEKFQKLYQRDLDVLRAVMRRS